MAPSAVRQLTVISTSGSSVAVVATWACRNVCPPVVHQYACCTWRVSTAVAAVVPLAGGRSAQPGGGAGLGRADAVGVVPVAFPGALHDLHGRRALRGQFAELRAAEHQVGE